MGTWRFDSARWLRPIQYYQDGRPKGQVRGSEDVAKQLVDVMFKASLKMNGTVHSDGTVTKTWLLKVKLPIDATPPMQWRVNGSLALSLMQAPMQVMWVTSYDPTQNRADFYYWIITRHPLPFDGINGDVATLILRRNRIIEAFILEAHDLRAARDSMKSHIDTWQHFPFNERMWQCKKYHYIKDNAYRAEGTLDAVMLQRIEDIVAGPWKPIRKLTERLGTDREAPGDWAWIESSGWRIIGAGGLKELRKKREERTLKNKGKLWRSDEEIQADYERAVQKKIRYLKNLAKERKLKYKEQMKGKKPRKQGREDYRRQQIAMRKAARELVFKKKKEYKLE